MLDDKVVTLRGVSTVESVTEPVNEKLIVELEKLLQAARTGELVGIAGVYQHRTNTSSFSFAGTVGSFAMLGALAALKDRLLKISLRETLPFAT
jgi:hypothetical protein